MLENLPFFRNKNKDKAIERDIELLMERIDQDNKESARTLAENEDLVNQIKDLLGTDRYLFIPEKIARIDVLKKRLEALEAYRMLADSEKKHPLSSADRNRRMELGIELSGTSVVADVFGDMDRTESELKSLEVDSTGFKEYEDLLAMLKILADEKERLLINEK